MSSDLRWVAACLALGLAGGCRSRGGTDAEAARLCRALHALPEERRAQCCGTAPSVVFADECVSVLTATLRSNALAADPGSIDRCLAALDRAHVGCGWVGPFGPAFPQECHGLFKGKRSTGDACGSSLECRDGLFCTATGPDTAGHCAPPGETGSPCGGTADALAAYTRQDLDVLHPQCQGFCNRRRCAEKAAPGSPCRSSAECGAAAHCAAGACLDGPASPGQRCSGGDCAWGLRCIEGTCRAPLASGAACTTAPECQGGCVPTDGGKRCALRCDVR